MRRALKIKDVRRAAPSSGEVKRAALEPQPVAKAQRAVPSSAEVKKAPHRPHIPAHIVRQLKAETRQCTYRSPLTGKRCEERHGLQIEHCNPYAMGGGDELENLTLLCATHNRLRAIQTYGPAKLKPAR